MNNYIFLGRERDLALAEIESLYSSDFRIINDEIIKCGFAVEIKDLGTVVKTSQMLMKLEGDWRQGLLDNIAQLIDKNKTTLGLSVYGEKVNPRKLAAFGYKMKRELKHSGYKVRVVPNKRQQLNAAQVLRNQLTKTGNFELNIIIDGNETVVTRTTEIQDIDEYSYIDQNKPFIDPINGMLPHKLAKTMINLAAPKQREILLDPFCGSGTIAMEALLKKMAVHASDLSEEMVEHTTKNLAWLNNKKLLEAEYKVNQADARNAIFPPHDIVVAETYLGPPLKKLPEFTELYRIMDEINDLHVRFLKNLYHQTRPGHRIVLAVPAWRDRKKLYDLKMVDDLEEIGYTTASFKHVDELVYFRPYQVVARRILVLIRK